MSPLDADELLESQRERLEEEFAGRLSPLLALLSEAREFLDALPQEIEGVEPLLERIDTALGRDV